MLTARRLVRSVQCVTHDALSRSFSQLAHSIVMPTSNPFRNISSNLSPCDLCHNSLHILVSRRDRSNLPLQTVICQSCGLVSTNPRPTDQEIDHFYREEYRTSYKKTSKPKLKHVYRSALVALERLSYLLPMLQKGVSILDMGAGGGEMLYMLRGLGFQVHGIEPNIGYGTAALKMLELPVQLTTCQEACVEPGSQDVVTCFHVLEHMAHPVEALSVMSKWLKPEGLLMVEVPNVMSECQWPQSRYHIGHLHHFSTSTLALVGQKSGLQPVDAFTSSDGGNLMVLFRRSEYRGTNATSTAIPGHAQRVLLHLRNHTNLDHMMSHHPYIRPLTKVANRCLEQGIILRFRDPRAILDHMLKRAQQLAINLREVNHQNAIRSSRAISLAVV